MYGAGVMASSSSAEGSVRDGGCFWSEIPTMFSETKTFLVLRV